MAATERHYQLAREILEANRYIALATAGPDGPWVVPVGFSFDNGKLSWHSELETRHSQYLKDDPRLAFEVFDTSAPAGRDKALCGRGKLSGVQPVSDSRARYEAEVTELWLQPNEQVDGQWMPREQLDPKELGGPYPAKG